MPTQDALARFAASCAVVTCEFENVPAETLQAAARAVPVFPGAKSFAVAQDRLVEKDFVTGLGIPSHPTPASTRSKRICGRALPASPHPGPAQDQAVRL